jgi:L-alanine-DL-glutamate epimerase-like enolase superfamily enzyme
VKISISGDGDELRVAHETAFGLGFRAFKVKVGRDPASDVARVRLARELAGDDALLGADANGGWPLPIALRAVRELAESRIAFIEQPVRADDLEGLRDVRALGVPVIADESVYSPDDVWQIGRAGAADVVNVYIGTSSGLDRAIESARLATELGMEVVIGSNGEMGIGAAAQLHVACACERISAIPHGVIGHHFYEEDSTLTKPLDINGVVARLPEAPGLGVEPSEEVRRSFS